MRSDYAFYLVAIIFFILTGTAAWILAESEKPLWVITTAVLGLLFIGLGYSQRPKPKPTAITPLPAPPSPQPVQPTVTEIVVEEKPVTIIEPAPTKLELTEVKGIGEKRAGQLKALGINSVERLAEASAKDLAEKLKISPKITGKWIEDAKRLAKKS